MSEQIPASATTIRDNDNDQLAKKVRRVFGDLAIDKRRLPAS